MADALVSPRRFQVPTQLLTPQETTSLRGAGATKIGRVDVSEPASISTGIAARYATALFELARDSGGLGALEADVASLQAALNDSTDLRSLISSPIYSREDQGRAIAAIGTEMALTGLVSNTLKLMAGNRRLFVLPQLLAVLRDQIAAAKGEVTADVTAAKALSAKQAAALAKSLSASFDKKVQLNVAVDQSLIGGLVVKVGSKMIDTSIRSRLAALQNVMKEVG